MPEIKTHKGDYTNDKLDVVVNPTHDHYLIEGFDGVYDSTCEAKQHNSVLLKFQKGNPEINGVKGLTNEVLISVLIDRLRYFQSQQYRCDENAKAIDHLEQALAILKTRQSPTRV